MLKHLPKLLLMSLLLLLGGLTIGCAEDEPIEPVPPTPTTAAAIQPQHPEIAPTPTPGTRDFPLPAPTLLPVAARPDGQNCIDCHTDVEKIKLNAEAVEVVETQSEGEG